MTHPRKLPLALAGLAVVVAAAVAVPASLIDPDTTYQRHSDELSAGDMLKLEQLIADWHGVQDIQISAVGHSDSQPIAARNRQLFADNYELSRARANSAVAYLAAALDVGLNGLQVEGRGPDYPIADNATKAGQAINRRGEFVFKAVAPQP